MTHWYDTSPHAERWLQTPDVRLHCLDWGGPGEPVILLAGLGHSAHIFDEFAPALTDRWRVVGLTRRSHGASEQPLSGYSIPELVDDLRLALDALRIERAHIIGHSVAGDEMTAFATAHPQRVRSLVFLDAALDRSNWFALGMNDPIDERMPDEYWAAFEQFRAEAQRRRGYWGAALEADLRATLVTLPNGSVELATRPATFAALFSSIQQYTPDYRPLTMPVLSLWTLRHTHHAAHWLGDSDQVQAAQAFVDNHWRPWVIAQIARFKEQVPHARTVEFRDASHYFFLTERDIVVQHVRRFLESVAQRGDVLP